MLRKQLLAWLLTPLFVLLAVDSVMSYGIALAFAQRAYDRSLVEIARDLSLHLRTTDGALTLDLPPESRDMLLGDPVDHVRFQLLGPEDRTLAGEPLPAPPQKPEARETVYDSEAGGVPIRVVQLRVPERSAVVRVAETTAKRRTLAREILASVVLPQAVLIVAAAILVWFGVVRGLAPLDKVRREVEARAHGDWSAISSEAVPGEVAPLLESINELVARLDRALTLQHRFIANAAHQLKTPIAVLKTQIEVALREQDPQRQREALASSRAGLERLSHVVSQLLSLARNEPEAAARVHLAPLDLEALALKAAQEWVPEALKKRIDLGFEGCDRPVTVRGEPGRLRELLDNLLDNAVRYTPEGARVTVRVSDGEAPCVSVSDDGPRIPPGERQRVFERFHRLLGTEQEGSGLGLAIVEEIARLHGGRIELRDDADGTGNTFSVSFPPP